MSGNVSEWTASFPDGRPVTRLRENANVVLRGGSFRRPGSRESASWRWAYPAITTRESDIGFRCAQDAPDR
jgi:formylglycine-generating enzyme required for sulfatase activity